MEKMKCNYFLKFKFKRGLLEIEITFFFFKMLCNPLNQHSLGVGKEV